MILYHFTAEPFVFDPTRTYDQNTATRGYGKPVGLWLSDETEDDGWKSWCTGEEWALGNLEHATAFELVEGHNVLLIHTDEALVAFQAEYGIPDPHFEQLFPKGGNHYRGIDWPRVTAEYDGILITPHLWGSRFDMLWYSGWDCASGCFWNLDAVRVAEPALEAEHG